MRVGSRMPATSKMELFVTIVTEWKLSKIVLKSSILDFTMVLEPSDNQHKFHVTIRVHLKVVSNAFQHSNTPEKNEK